MESKSVATSTTHNTHTQSQTHFTPGLRNRVCKKTFLFSRLQKNGNEKNTSSIYLQITHNKRLCNWNDFCVKTAAAWKSRFIYERQIAFNAQQWPIFTQIFDLIKSVRLLLMIYKYLSRFMPPEIFDILIAASSSFRHKNLRNNKD